MSLVIIGGFPRSGTRQFADIMNYHDEFIIQGEIHSKVFTKISELLTLADQLHYEKRTEKSFFERRSVVAYEMYRLLSKTNSQPLIYDYRKKFLGLKQPLIEAQFREIKNIFSKDHQNCNFYVCLRNMFDNFLSLNSAFDYDTKRYAIAINKSIVSLRAMDDDEFFSIYPLDLDNFIISEDKVSWIQQYIFEPLNFEASDEFAQSCLQNVGNRNKTPVEKRKHHLDKEFLKNLTQNKELKENARWLEERFSVDLLSKLLEAI